MFALYQRVKRDAQGASSASNAAAMNAPAQRAKIGLLVRALRVEAAASDIPPEALRTLGAVDADDLGLVVDDENSRQGRLRESPPDAARRDAWISTLE
jgi:hypothetical protein